MDCDRLPQLFFIGIALIGCGSPDNSDRSDAGSQHSDAMAIADAAIAGAQGFLGRICPENDCPSDATCLSVMPVPTAGYCSKSCGESAALGVPPSGGDSLCNAIFDQSLAGTPKCGIVIDQRVDNGATVITWACAIDCSADGQCPTGLSCQDFNLNDRFCLR